MQKMSKHACYPVLPFSSQLSSHFIGQFVRSAAESRRNSRRIATPGSHQVLSETSLPGSEPDLQPPAGRLRTIAGDARRVDRQRSTDREATKCFDVAMVVWVPRLSSNVMLTSKVCDNFGESLPLSNGKLDFAFNFVNFNVHFFQLALYCSLAVI
jgi:hypothetical protein